MDKCREQFEEWYSEFYIPQDASDTWQPVIKAMALKAWQASRQALVVELPFGECDTTVQDIDVLKCRLESAGIKWTE